MKKYLLIFSIFAFAILVVYSNTFHSPMHYDDSVNIIKNKHIKIDELNWQSIKGTWFAGGRRGDIYHPILYRPVAMFTLAMNYYIHQLEVFGYHIVNTLLHIITAIFLFLFIKEIFLLPKLREKYGDYVLHIAGIATLLWALNPVQLTNVTYIVQRQNSLCGMFYIIAMYFYIRARKSYSLPQYIFSALAICLAMGSKENAILVFPSIALFEVMFFGMSRKKLILFGGFVIAGILLTLAVQGPETFGSDSLMKGYEKRDFTLGQRLLTEPRVILFYIMLLALPYHGLLSLTHVVRPSEGLFNPPETLISFAIITIILALAIIKFRKHPLISYCVFFFFLNHLVEGTIFPLELVYEHRNYIPSFFFFVPIVIMGFYLYRHFNKIMAVVAMACLIFFFGYNTYTQNKVWKTELGLWSDVCRKSPDPRSVFNYAGALYVLKDYTNALKYWELTWKFNDAYGTDYSENSDIIPYGRVIQMAGQNSFMLTQLRDGKLRKGVAIEADLEPYLRSTNG